MASIRLTVRSNFEEATRELKNFGSLIETEAKRIESFQKSFKTKKIDSFIQKNQQAAAAVKAICGPLETAIARQEGLRREMERLIRGGIDPQDAAIEKLNREYQRANKQAYAMARAQEFNAKAIRQAILALTAMTNTASQNGGIFNDVLGAFASKSGNAEEALKRQIEGFAAGAFTIEQSKIALQNLSIAIGGKLLPALVSMALKLINLIQDTERFRRVMDILLPVIAGVDSGLAGFLAISKIIPIIKGLSSAMAVLNAVMLANPALLIAAAIVAAVDLTVLLIRNWDKVVAFFSTTIEKLKMQFGNFAGAMKVGWVVAVNTIKSAFISLGVLILDKVLGSIQRLLDVAARLPGVGRFFAGISANVDSLRSGLQAAKEEAIAQSNAVIESVKAEQTARAEEVKRNIAAIKAESEARSQALSDREKANEAAVSSANVARYTNPTQLDPSRVSAGAVSSSGSGLGDSNASAARSLQDRLSVLHNAEAIAYQDRLSTFGEFLNARMEQEGISGAERIQFLQDELLRINELESLSDAERIAAEEAVTEKIIATETKLAEARRQIMRSSLQHQANFYGALSELMEAFGSKAYGVAVAQKAFSAASAAINSYLAFTQVLADPTLIGPFTRIIAASAVLASGLAQQIKILRTPIPSAETGGRFVVPNSSRVDSVGLRVNPGETVDVTPRGDIPERDMSIQLYLDRELIWSTVQQGVDYGRIVIDQGNNVA